MPDLINICRICDKQFKLRDDFLEHVIADHEVPLEKVGEISNEYRG